MTNQDLEDLLKSKSVICPENTPLQESISNVQSELASSGGKKIINRVFASNPLWIGTKIKVLDKMGEEREISVQLKSKLSLFEAEIEYFDTNEVLEF